MIIEKLGSFKLPAWNTMIYTTFSFSPDSIFQWFSVTYTHFILTLRHGNRCDKSAGCHTDARTRGMLAVVVQLRHMLHTATAGVPHAWGWVEEGPGCPELPPPFPTCLSLGTSLHLSFETGLCCSLQYSFLCLPSSRITSALFHSISRFLPLIISISANNVRTLVFLYDFQEWFLTAPVEDESPFFFFFLLPSLLVFLQLCLRCWALGAHYSRGLICFPRSLFYFFGFPL